MTSTFEDDNAVWRLCEVAWSLWLQKERYVVFHLGEAIGNDARTNAPLINVAGKRLRAPDLQSVKAGRSEYWEVKFRSRSDVDQLTGAREHWMEYAAFRDYLAVADGSGCRLWIILHESESSVSGARWLLVDVKALRELGRRGSRFGRGGEEVDAWVWPVAGMEVVPGPDVSIIDAAIPILPTEGIDPPLIAAEFEPLERRIRQSASTDELVQSDKRTPLGGRIANVLEHDRRVGLDVLRRSLGVPTMPLYSVLRIGLDGIDIAALLGLLDYGIRVFVIADVDVPAALETGDIQAFRDSRLLEWATVPELEGIERWVVDGQVATQASADIERALQAADFSGHINAGQYRIVHAAADSDILVTAGAGTGKTETMSERLVFLLATFETRSGLGESRPYGLRADDVVLVTFTREAAREMRARIAWTLMLRQRLSSRCVLPALAWMMQLSGAEVSTIHAYAKRIAQSGAGALGLAPGFSVSRQTMPFRDLIHAELSPHLEQLIASYPSQNVPAAYQWQENIERIWRALENNGVSLMRMPGAQAAAVDWGVTAQAEDLEGAVTRTVHDVVAELSEQYRDFCLDSQSITTAQLVPVALAALRVQTDPPVRQPKFLFIDEFQDTDALQMDLLLEVGERLDARLFVVGDAKQGIYRFRGAEGNAFQELRDRVAVRERSNFREFSLTRNFRSGELLLRSLHPYFRAWGVEKYLVYADGDALRPNTLREDLSSELTYRQVPWGQTESEAAGQVADWRGEHRESSIAVLCRDNWQAKNVQTTIRDTGGSCELLVGGDFYRTPAVREFRVLLEAVSDPTDAAAILELCETRWAAGILRGELPIAVPIEYSGVWSNHIASPQPWRDRVATVAGQDNFDRSDLMPVRQRLDSLRAMLDRMSFIAWVVECARSFVPEGCSLPGADDDLERRRYSRCFDHLLTILDAQFSESPATIERVLPWLRLLIATDDSEDEPVELDQIQGTTTALTVHKAKGLEFDRVLIPYTRTEFMKRDRAGTQVSVLRQPDGVPRVMWRWRPASGGGSFSNVDETHQHLWDQNAMESVLEETRLLYVALTRARHELLVFVVGVAKAPDHQHRPNSWRELLDLGRA